MARYRQTIERVDVFLDDAQTFLDRLHEGARRCAATPAEFPPGWRGEWDRTTLEFIINCCVLRARSQREKGAPYDAAETILDSLQLARFWAGSGNGEGRSDISQALANPADELREILEQEVPSRDQLRRIDLELEPLEAALRSPASSFEPALARWAEALEAMEVEPLLKTAPYRWRYLLPTRLMKAEAFEFYDFHVRRLLADEATSYLEFARDLKLLYQQMEDSKNPIIDSVAYWIRELEWSGLVRMAEFRLLRLAAHYGATGEVLQLKDPFGGDFLHSKTGNRMKFWSVDSDGRNDGGNTGRDRRWTRLRPGDPTAGAPMDLVIEVPLNE